MSFKSTSFKSCKYHKQSMKFTQLFAEEVNDTLTLQSSGVSTENDLEFADCIKSSAHELNNIASHLLRCSKFIKTKYFENVNGGKDNNLVQIWNSPLDGVQTRNSSALEDELTPSNETTDQQETSTSKTTKRKSLKCFLLSKMFVTKLLMYQHFDKFHSVVMYECSSCGKMFGSKGTFYSHLKTHKNGLYNCQLCKKTFDLHTSWYNHMKIHWTKSYKHQVENCDYSCKSESTFHKHCYYFHLPEKRVHCSKCNMLFQMPTNIYYHRLKCH